MPRLSPFILPIVRASFITGADKAVTRLGMAVSGLVASIMSHVPISSQIPPVGYLTFSDKSMVVTYFMALASSVINIIILNYQEKKVEAKAHRIHQMTAGLMFLLTPAAYVLLFWLLL